MGRSFRMYDETLDDFEIQSLPGELFKFYINLKCAYARKDGEWPDNESLAWIVRVASVGTLLKNIDVLVDAGLMYRTQDGALKFHRRKYEVARVHTHKWMELRADVFARDDYTCAYCGERGGQLECDHKHPFSRGGADDLDNLVTACRNCNRSKRDKTIEEWGAGRGAN